jgi:hypothetical protein
MAAAVATVSVLDERSSWVAGNKYFVEGTISISASTATYTTGGIACSFLQPLIKVTRTPVLVQVQGQGVGTTGTLFEYRYVPGVDASAGLLKIFTGGAGSAAGLAEFTSSGAIPADVSTDTITFIAIFNGMN